ncbi:hypothetical protein [Stappia sp. ES.058]|nr:hypothetical protein [Stappia sp. ES.058]SDU28559.1 hypothetical protein SAMN05428979_2744 [Stappia sp. ES.058]
MRFSDPTRTDTLTARKTSPWPLALTVTSAALTLTLIICFAFPNG